MNSDYQELYFLIVRFCGGVQMNLENAETPILTGPVLREADMTGKLIRIHHRFVHYKAI
jgi:hypothetical protein